MSFLCDPSSGISSVTVFLDSFLILELPWMNKISFQFLDNVIAWLSKLQLLLVFGITFQQKEQTISNEIIWFVFDGEDDKARAVLVRFRVIYLSLFLEFTSLFQGCCLFDLTIYEAGSLSLIDANQILNSFASNFYDCI